MKRKFIGIGCICLAICLSLAFELGFVTPAMAGNGAAELAGPMPFFRLIVHSLIGLIFLDGLRFILLKRKEA